MIKNELIKFFTPLKASIYGGIILIFIMIDDVIFRDNPSLVVNFYDFLHDNMKALVFVLPIILAPIVSEIFTYDYECGCMKFFLIYKKREKVFFYKMLSSIIITSVLIIFTFAVLNTVYTIENLARFNIINQINLSVKVMVMFLITLLPVLLIYILVSILCKNSAIISLLVFLLLIMSDFIPKTIGNITPRRFLWDCLLERRVDKFSIVLFLVYIAGFILLNLKLFNKKEIVH